MLSSVAAVHPAKVTSCLAASAIWWLAAATQSIRPMSEDERDELLYDMKVKWGKLNEAYGKLSFTLDVPSHMRRKEELEAEMTQLEKDIKTLQGRQVVVVDERRV